MPDIYLNMQELDEVLAGLDASIGEFDSATGVADGIAEAIGRPDGRGSLHGKANDFEDDWNNTRGELKDNLDQIRKHLQDVIDGWQNWDAEAAAAMQSSAPDNAV
ncbi:flagellar protein FlgN [Microbacterium gallinarum]|uniref:Flagellar protein FlgN n=1 Tax=Microbacterium gallinarum TaxID=2762209 RepID=A0ABR8X622_9MICO|nr:flagellar protein FlgN [Microbacterium gallinarum]MBD8024607.1 flagellar protein FlgN [Microbacterium gallinarum]